MEGKTSSRVQVKLPKKKLDEAIDIAKQRDLKKKKFGSKPGFSIQQDSYLGKDRMSFIVSTFASLHSCENA